MATLPMHFLTDAVVFLNSHFGASSGARTVHLDEVQCTGSENHLTECPRSSTVSCSAVHSYAGARCQGICCSGMVKFTGLQVPMILCGIIAYSKCQWKLYLW